MKGGTARRGGFLARTLRNNSLLGFCLGACPTGRRDRTLSCSSTLRVLQLAPPSWNSYLRLRKDGFPTHPDRCVCDAPSGSPTY